MLHQRLLIILLFLVIISACEPRYFDIPTTSMEGTLKLGSKVWRRSKPPQRNDLMIFKYPHDTTTYYIKRMVAVPGDTIQVIGTMVYVNGILQTYPSSIQHSYTIKTKQRINDRLFKQQNITEYGRSSPGYNALSSEENIAFFRTAEFVDTVQINYYPKGYLDHVYSDFNGWNRDNFGSYYLPKRGDKIEGQEILKRYAKLILENEGVDITGLTSYKFKKSYCFAMGDNRHNSLDSRYIGPIVMDLVRGTAVIL